MGRYRFLCAWCSAAVFGAAVVGGQVAKRCQATELTFVVDDMQSFLKLALVTETFIPFTEPQTPGSDTTSISGTLNVDLTGSTIQFLPTGDLQFALQTLPQAPLPGGDPGEAPAQIGLRIPPSEFADGVLAARDMVGEATSNLIPLVAGTFDASDVQLGSGGNFPYNITVLGSPISGSFIGDPGTTPNLASGGTLAFAGDTYTLTMPMLVYSAPISVMDITVLTEFSGQVVATAVVPEPSSWLLAVLGIAGLPLARRFFATRNRRTSDPAR